MLFRVIGPSAVTDTVQAISPISNPMVFRAIVLAWLTTITVLLIALRPLVLTLVDLAVQVRDRWDGKERRGQGK